MNQDNDFLFSFIKEKAQDHSLAFSNESKAILMKKLFIKKFFSFGFNYFNIYYLAVSIGMISTIPIVLISNKNNKDQIIETKTIPIQKTYNEIQIIENNPIESKTVISNKPKLDNSINQKLIPTDTIKTTSVIETQQQELTKITTQDTITPKKIEKKYVVIKKQDTIIQIDTSRKTINKKRLKW